MPALGTTVLTSPQAAETVAADGIDVTVVNCRFLRPYDDVTLQTLLGQHRALLVVEERCVGNGFRAFMAATVVRLSPSVRVAAHGVPDRTTCAASRPRQPAMAGLDAVGIAARARALHESEAITG